MHITVKSAKTLWEKSVGLIGQKNPQPLLIKTRFGIHTFGMRVPIDIVVLDETYTIVALKPSLAPNRFFFWHPQYDIVLELPAGTIKKSNLVKKQKVKLLINE